MSDLIEFNLDPETTILVEASDVAPTEGQREVSARGVLVEKASETFEGALEGVKPIARSIIAQMREAVADAREIQVEFGIKLTAAAGVVLAKAAAEGHCKISVKWVLTPRAA